jgi:hypothetical protein
VWLLVTDSEQSYCVCWPTEGLAWRITSSNVISAAASLETTNFLFWASVGIRSGRISLPFSDGKTLMIDSL